MKTFTKSSLTLIASLSFSLLSARAADLYWGAGGAVSPNNSWATAGNWYTDLGETTASAATPALADNLFFNTTPDNALGGTVAMSANTPFFARSMTFNTTAAMSFDQGNNARTLTLGAGGITVSSGSSTVSFNGSQSSLWLQAEADQTWTNNSSNTLTVRRLRAADAATGPVTVTLNAAGSGAITISFANAVTDSLDTTKSLGLVIDSAGTGNVSISGGSYSGGTLVKRGLLSSSGQIGNGSVFLGDISTGATAVRINLTGVSTSAITVHAGALGSAILSGSGSGDYQGDILLNRDIFLGSASSGSTLAFSGNISGLGHNVTIGRIGAATNSTFTFGGNSSYTGKTTIEGAIVVVSSLKNAGVNSNLGAATGANSVITMGSVADSTLRYTGAGDTTDRSIEIASNRTITLDHSGTGLLKFTGALAQSGTGSRTLTLAGATPEADGTGEFSGLISNDVPNVSVTKSGAGTWRLSNVANTYAGTTSVAGGVLEVMKLANQGSASSIGTGSIGNISFSGATLRYVGAGDSSNRPMNVGAAGGTIDASGSGAVIFSNTGAFAVASSTTSRTFTLTGVNTDANTMATDLNDPSGSATLSITKSGPGTWVLTNANGYTGATTINGGTLVVGAGGSIASGSAVAVNDGGTLAGTGTVAGMVTVNGGGTLSPGSSPGLQNLGGLVLSDGGHYNWQVLDAEGTAGTGYDSYNLSGSLDLSGLTGATDFNINLWSLSGIGPDVSGAALNFDNAVDQSWTLVSTGNSITGFDPSFFTVNVAANNGTAGFANALGGGTFSVGLADGDTDLVLNFTAIPEPSVLVMMLVGGFSVLVGVRRKRRRD